MATNSREPSLRPLLYWLNSLPAAGPRCLLAATADDLLADEGRALRDLIGLLLLRSPSASGPTLAQALEALARRRSGAFERHVRPSLVAADGRAATWDAIELAAQVLREQEGGGGGGQRLLPALLWGLRRVVDEEEDRDGAATPLGGAGPPPQSSPPAAVAVAVPAPASHSNPSSPCQRLRPAYHWNAAAGGGDPDDRSSAPHTDLEAAALSPARGVSSPPVRERRRRQRQQQRDIAPPPPQAQPQPVPTMPRKRAAVRAWLAALGLLTLPPQEEVAALSSWGEGDPLRDGRLLCRLFVVLEPAIASHTKGLKRVLERVPRTRQEAAETVACALWLFRCRCSPPIPGGRFDDAEVDGVLAGEASGTWGLLWELMQLYAPSSFSSSLGLLLSSCPSASGAPAPAPRWRAHAAHDHEHDHASNSSSPNGCAPFLLAHRDPESRQPHPEDDEGDEDEEGQIMLLEATLASWIGALVGESVPSLPACEAALRDGTLLCQLVGRAVGREIVGWHPHPGSRDECLVNLTKAVEALRTWAAPMGRRFLYLGIEEDIYRGEWEAIVGLLEDAHRALDGVVPPRPPIPSPREGHYLGRSVSPARPPSDSRKKKTAPQHPPHTHLLDLYPESEPDEERRHVSTAAVATTGVSPLPSSPPSPRSAFEGGGRGKAARQQQQQKEERGVWELLDWLAARGIVVEDPRAVASRFADGVLLARLVAGLLSPPGPDDGEEAASARRALEEAGAVDLDAGAEERQEEVVAVVPRLKRIKLALGSLRRLRGTGGGMVAAALPLHLLHREIDVLEGLGDAIVPLLLGIKHVYDARGLE